jgi:uncharacterized protein (DUF1330 family)
MVRLSAAIFTVLFAIGAASAQTVVPPSPTVTAPSTLDANSCDNKPVIMVVSGVSIDRARMLAYGKAIADSGLYATLGGYYVNNPRPVAVFEGEPPQGYTTLLVRFPCLAHARAFWYSKTYQETIVPMRRNPDAGVFTVTVYAEADLPAYMKGRAKPARYTRKPKAEAAAGIARVPGQ